jgi:enoyl-CoA hydratase/carnithine racemase
VNAAVPAETTVGTATALAHRLLDREPWLYRYLKRALDTATEPREPTAESPSADTREPTVESPSANTREATVESSSHSEADQTVSVDEPRPALYRITLDRRTRLNAITDRMTRELVAAVRTVADRDPTAVVVRGRGRRAFSVGLDLDAPVAADREAAAAAATRLQTVTDSLASLDAPTVCVLTGYALGGGLELALAADSRVATPDTEVGFPEVTHGAVPAAGGTQRAPLCVGRGRATELLFLGCRYAVDATAVTTLTDIVVPPERLPEAALDTAEALARTESSDRPRANDGVAAAEGLAVELAGLRRWSSK